MKLKHVIILMAVFLLHSCIVKSLNPFYTEDKITSELRLEGKWKSKNGFWEIKSFEKMWKNIEKNQEETTKEDSEIFERFKHSYAVKYSQNTNKDDSFTESALSQSAFIATAFDVDGHLFLDFFPVEYESDGLNNLVSQHLLSTHSACFVEFNEDGSFKLKWLDEDVIGRLIENHNLKIKYEQIGYEDDFVLTAKSQELYRFLQKFMASNIENKWENDQIYTLAPVDEKQ